MPLFVPANVSIIGMSGTAVPLTGSTAETALATIAVPAMGPNDGIRLEMRFTVGANNANAKTARVRLGSLVGNSASFQALASNISQRNLVTVVNNGATNSQTLWVSGAGTSSLGTSTSAFSAGAQETNAGFSLIISGQLANGSDTLTLVNYIVELLRA